MFGPSKCLAHHAIDITLLNFTKFSKTLIKYDLFRISFILKTFLLAKENNTRKK